MSELDVIIAELVGASPSKTALGDAKLAYDTGKTAYDAGDYKTAITYFSTAYNLSKKDDLLWDIALSYEKSKDYINADKVYRQYLTTPAGQKVSADINKKLADIADVIKMAKDVVSMQSQQQAGYAAAASHYQAGMTAYNANDCATALKEFQLALPDASAANKPMLYFNIGACQEKLGDFKGAAASFRTYLIFPESAKDKDMLAAKLPDLDAKAKAQVDGLANAAKDANTPQQVQQAGSQVAVTATSNPDVPAEVKNEALEALKAARDAKTEQEQLEAKKKVEEAGKKVAASLGHLEVSDYLIMAGTPVLVGLLGAVLIRKHPVVGFFSGLAIGGGAGIGIEYALGKRPFNR
jgi:tetratricopeptide (TPR) repeat protein